MDNPHHQLFLTVVFKISNAVIGDIIIDFFGYKNIPMILMSGRDRQTEAETIGVEFLLKPFDLKKLESTIQLATIRAELTHA